MTYTLERVAMCYQFFTWISSCGTLVALGALIYQMNTDHQLKEWEQANPDLARKGMNIRDTASIAQLLILSNLEVINSDFVRKNVSRRERIKALVEMAKAQMESLDKNNIEQRFRKQFPENNVGRLLE